MITDKLCYNAMRMCMPIIKVYVDRESDDSLSIRVTIVPSLGLGLHLDPAEFQIAAMWWLGMNSSIQSVCPFCPNITLDPLGHHAVSCRHGEDVVIRHNCL